uniref:WD repeat-containing protein 75 second beta-propeller domain-containing protein n=1 Tax=Caenorhabditis japonica TaxID=281687 RepID=A0A8R1IA34_CAEJA
METADNIEVTLVGQAYSNVSISPNNRILATSGSTCEFLSDKNREFRRFLKHDSDVIATFFQSNERLVTVTENGEVSEFEERDKKFEKLSSRRVTAFPVVAAFAQPPKSDEDSELKLWFVLKKSDSEKYDVCISCANGSIEKVLEIPSGLRKEHISICDGVVSFIQGLTIQTIVTSDTDRSVLSDTKFTAKKGGGEGDNVNHKFEYIASNGNFLVASISDGRVLKWSNVKTNGVSDVHHRIHWHKTAPHVAVTEFGNVLSAGAECVLARHTPGQKEPTLLPRLVAPVTGLVLSPDSSTVALVMEDNSIHTVLLSTMAIKSSLSTLEYCPRSLNTVFNSDPLRNRRIVMNGKPGSIQWFDPVTISTSDRMLVTLENSVDGDMSSRGIRSAFRDVLTTSLTTNFLVSIEKFVNFDSENTVRFWQRFENNQRSVLVASITVPRDVVFVATCANTASKFANTIVTASTSGTISVWDYTPKDVREELEKSRNWQEAEIRAISGIQSDGKFVSAHGRHAVVWNVKNMKIIDVLDCEDDIIRLDFAADGRHLIVSTKKSVVCWDTLCLLLVWRIRQSVGIHVSSVGSFAYDGAQVMRFDTETGRVLGSVQFSAPVDELIVIQHRQDALIYVAKTSKGILCNRPANLKSSGKGANSDSQTPFQQLARLSASAASAASKPAQFVRQPRPEAARLFAGPVHQLPPISMIAPLFIEKSLLPPLVRA